MTATADTLTPAQLGLLYQTRPELTWTILTAIFERNDARRNRALQACVDAINGVRF